MGSISETLDQARHVAPLITTFRFILL